MRQTIGADPVHVQHTDGGGQRIERRRGIVFRTQQALFFRRDRQEHDGPRRPGGLHRGAGQFQQHGRARRVVERAVVNPVAFGVRETDPQVVPMGGVENPLARKFRPGNGAHDVFRDHLLGVDGVVGPEGDAGQGHRLEVSRLSLLLQGLEVETRRLHHGRRRVALHPAFQRRMRPGRVLADHIENLVGVGILHRRPAIGGRGRLMDHQEADGPTARRLLKFIGPATVVGHGLAAKVAASGFEVGVVDQHQGHLALQVDALEVIPVALRRVDAVAHENHRRVLDRQAVQTRLGGADGDLLALGPGPGFPGQVDAHRHRPLDPRPRQRHILGPGARAVLAAITGGLQAGRLHLGDQIGDGLDLAGRRRAPALIFVGRQHLDVPQDAGRIDARRGGQSGARHQGHKGRTQEQLLHRNTHHGVESCATLKSRERIG